MKTLLTRLAPPVVLAFATAANLWAASDGWVDDFEAAKKTAAAEKKDLLIDFTGSDWCVWCKRLDSEVFAQEAFKKEAPKKFVLVTLDFPRKTKPAENIQKQNERLQDEFKVKGFPTVYLADATGKPYAKTGYQAGGAEAYLKHLDELSKARETRDAELAAAEKANGVEKARHLKAALDALDDEVAATFYASTAEEIVALDKDDSLGLKKERDFKAAKDKLEGEVGELAQSRKSDEIVKKVDAFIAEKKLAGAEKQEVLFIKLSAYPPPDGIDGADKLMDEVIAVDANTKVGTRAKEVKEVIAKMRAQSAGQKQPAKGEKKAE